LNTEQDRRAFLAIVLSVGVYFIWQAYFAPLPPTESAAAMSIDASVDTSPSTESAESVESIGSVTPATAVPARPLAASAVVAERTEAVSGDGWEAEIHSGNGTFRDISLQNYTRSPQVNPLYSWLLDKVQGKADGGWAPYEGGDDPQPLMSEKGALVLAGGGVLDDDGADISGAPSVYAIERHDQVWVATRMRSDGLHITKRYAPTDEPFTFDVEITFRNDTSSSIPQLWVGAADEMDPGAGRFDNALRPLAHVDGSIEHLLDLEDLEGAQDERYIGAVDWFGVGDRYFMAVLVPEEAINAQVVMDTLPSGRSGSFLLDNRTLDTGASRTYALKAFLGPKDLDYLKAYGHNLDTAVEFGWFGFFSKILLFLLKMFQSGVVNWGVSIVLLTVLVKLAFFPLTQKAFVSSRRMQVLQPKLNELREKYKDNKELQTQETMKLFRENNVNPMGSCLPTLIQLPVWFALYNVMLYSVELYDSSFLYLQDLSAEDPYGLLPTIYAVVLFVQQRMMPMANMDETQQKIFRMMPLLFAVWMFVFPSGLVLYFSINMLLTIGQQWLIRRRFKEEAA